MANEAKDIFRQVLPLVAREMLAAPGRRLDEIKGALTRSPDMTPFNREQLRDPESMQQAYDLAMNFSPQALTFAGPKAAGFGAAQAAGKVFEGVDKMPRFEISDNMAKIRALPKALREKALGEVLDHPELFQNYPELSDVPVKKMLPTLDSYGVEGRYDPIAKQIFLKEGPGQESVLLHEVQHAIQDKEGFARGGSPSNLADKAMDKYNRLAGEVEARNVQRRLNFTPEQRQSIPYTETLDVSPENQIVSRGGGENLAKKAFAKPIKIAGATIDVNKVDPFSSPDLHKFSYLEDSGEFLLGGPGNYHADLINRFKGNEVKAWQKGYERAGFENYMNPHPFDRPTHVRGIVSKTDKGIIIGTRPYFRSGEVLPPEIMDVYDQSLTEMAKKVVNSTDKPVYMTTGITNDDLERFTEALVGERLERLRRAGKLYEISKKDFFKKHVFLGGEIVKAKGGY